MARKSWLNDAAQEPQIERYARQLESFVQALADGKVEAHELKEQEARVVALMKEVEPKLDDALHDKVTQLLCELTAYDIMQMMHLFEQSRPKTKFRG